MRARAEQRELKDSRPFSAAGPPAAGAGARDDARALVDEAAAPGRDDDASSSRGTTREEFAPARRLRVLVVAPSLDILGGQAVQAARLLEGLREEPSLEVELLPINPRLPGPLRRLQSVKYVRTLVTSAAYVASLLARVRRFDVIHIFSASYFSFVLAPTPALLVSKLYGKAALLNYHSGEAEDHLRRWARTAPPTVRAFDRVAVPSGYLVDVFGRFGLEAQAVFNHLDAARFPSRERRPLRPVFLSNRNHEPHYNVGCVLRAFALIQQRHADARLTVAGDGSQRADLERLARELNLRNVEFVGRVPPEKMPELYDGTDVYLNAPDVDNMPVSVLEAFAAGTPVVTTDAGGIPYVVADGETGFVVPRGDAGALAERACRLLEDDALAQKLIARARREGEKYSWEAVRADWLRLYRELARAGERTSKVERAAHATVDE